MFIDLLIIAVIIAFNAFFVAAEFAIVKVRHTQIALLESQGHQRAKIAHHILKRLNEYLSAAQLGVTLASLGLGWVAEPIFEHLLSPVFPLINVTDPGMIYSLSAATGFALITFIHITIGEQVPKAIAIQYPKQMTLLVAVPFRLFNVIFRPFIYLINNVSNLLVRLLGVKQSERAESQHSEEELRLLLREGEKTGVIDDTEHELIENIFDFGDKTVADALVPRTQMFTLQADTLLAVAVDQIIREGYSRIPVFGENHDDVLGILFSKDLLRGLVERSEKTVRDLIRPAMYIVETKSLSVLLREMQKNHVEIAIVVNEYGGLEGMITIEDILEEIVGDLQDEHDSESSGMHELSDGSFIVAAITPIDDFNERLGAALPESPHYTTVGGFILKLFGHIPVKGERTVFEKLEFRTEQVTKNRILTLRVTKKKA